MEAASDPRASGPGSFILDVEGWDAALPTATTNWVVWGYQEIERPDGNWAGGTYGLYDNEGVLHLYGILA